jgi:hypothetical protein
VNTLWQAVVNFAKVRSISLAEAKDFEAITGKELLGR